MDSKSIMFLFTINSTFITLLFLFFILFNKKKNRYLIAYTIGKGFQITGVFCFSMRFIFPDFISLHLGCAFLIIGYAIEIFSVVSYDNVFRKSVFNLMLFPAIFFVFVLLIFLSSPKFILAILVAIFGAYYFAFGGIVLLKKKIKPNLLQ